MIKTFIFENWLDTHTMDETMNNWINENKAVVSDIAVYYCPEDKEIRYSLLYTV